MCIGKNNVTQLLVDQSICNNCDRNNIVYVPFVVISKQSFPYLWHHRITTRITRRVPLEEQELTIFKDHLGSFTSCFCGIRVSQSLTFCVVLCRSLFVLFILAVILIALLRWRVSNCPFAKLFLQITVICTYIYNDINICLYQFIGQLADIWDRQIMILSIITV